MTIQKESYDCIPKLGDVVKVLSVARKNDEILVGERGIIIEIDMDYEFPYNIQFLNRNIQKINSSLGELLWKRENFVVLSYD